MILRMGLFFFLLSFVACNSKTKSAETPTKTKAKELTELDWILGKWKREDTGELELWSKKEKSFFGGMMVELKGQQQAVIQEVLALEGRKDGIYFSSKINGPGNANRIEYKMSNKNFEAPKFSNPSDGYPQHISYMKIGNDKIKVALEDRSGRETSFYYVREI